METMKQQFEPIIVNMINAENECDIIRNDRFVNVTDCVETMHSYNIAKMELI